MVVFGDDSGGKHSSDPRRRRCGVAALVIRQVPGSEEWETVGRVSGILVGRLQTSPRAELFAFCLCLEGTRGPVHFITDQDPVTSAWERG